MLSNCQRNLLLDDTVRSYFGAHLMKPITAISLVSALNESYSARYQKSLLREDASETIHHVSLAGVEVLLVEDNLLNQAIALDVLGDLGVQVTVANNGQEALACYQGKPKAYAVILMDIQMPVMDGVTATRLLKTQYACDVPIIAMTAGVLQSEREQYLANGMSGFIAKPIDHAELYRVIDHWVSASRVNLNARAGGHSSEDSAVVNTQTATKLATATHNSTLRAFNIDRINTLTRGKAERIERLGQSLQALIADGQKPLVAVEQALLQGNIDAAKFSLHTLKGVAGNYGADKLAHYIHALEVHIADQGLGCLTEDLAPIKIELNEFLACAQRWVDNNQVG